jgi:hypothetical protein
LPREGEHSNVDEEAASHQCILPRY